jgi:rRNA maturation endonuclease Nob1
MSLIQDPWTPEESVYECYGCGSRVVVEDHLGTCPDCGDAVKNIAVAQE